METKGKVDVLAAMRNSVELLGKHVLVPAPDALAELIHWADEAVYVLDHKAPGRIADKLRDALSALRSSQGGREGDEWERQS